MYYIWCVQNVAIGCVFWFFRISKLSVISKYSRMFDDVLEEANKSAAVNYSHNVPRRRIRHHIVPVQPPQWGVRYAASSLSSHTSHLFSLTQFELEIFRSHTRVGSSLCLSISPDWTEIVILPPPSYDAGRESTHTSPTSSPVSVQMPPALAAEAINVRVAHISEWNCRNVCRLFTPFDKFMDVMSPWMGFTGWYGCCMWSVLAPWCYWCS